MARLKLGEWNAICDVCGFKFKSSELRKRWDNLMVCNKDFERRHEQTFLRTQPEDIAPPWVRPQSTDQFELVCTIVTSSAYADFGTTDCMRVENTNPSYSYIYKLYIEGIIPPLTPPPAPAPAPSPSPSPPSSPALKFNVASNSMYLPLRSVGGM